MEFAQTRYLTAKQIRLMQKSFVLRKPTMDTIPVVLWDHFVNDYRVDSRPVIAYVVKESLEKHTSSTLDGTVLSFEKMLEIVDVLCPKVRTCGTCALLDRTHVHKTRVQDSDTCVCDNTECRPQRMRRRICLRVF